MSASDNTTGPRWWLGVPWGARVMEPPTGETMNTKYDLRTRRRTIAGLATFTLPLFLFFFLSFFLFSRETPHPLLALIDWNLRRELFDLFDSGRSLASAFAFATLRQVRANNRRMGTKPARAD